MSERRPRRLSLAFGHCATAASFQSIKFARVRCALSDCSRYLLRCQAMARTDTDHVWPVLDAAFREFGLPYRLRSDNGPPFASCGPAGCRSLPSR